MNHDISWYLMISHDISWCIMCLLKLESIYIHSSPFSTQLQDSWQHHRWWRIKLVGGCCTDQCVSSDCGVLVVCIDCIGMYRAGTASCHGLMDWFLVKLSNWAENRNDGGAWTQAGSDYEALYVLQVSASSWEFWSRGSYSGNHCELLNRTSH